MTLRCFWFQNLFNIISFQFRTKIFVVLNIYKHWPHWMRGSWWLIEVNGRGSARYMWVVLGDVYVVPWNVSSLRHTKPSTLMMLTLDVKSSRAHGNSTLPYVLGACVFRAHFIWCDTIFETCKIIVSIYGSYSSLQ